MVGSFVPEGRYTHRWNGVSSFGTNRFSALEMEISGIKRLSIEQSRIASSSPSPVGRLNPQLVPTMTEGFIPGSRNDLQFHGFSEGPVLCYFE